MPVHGFSHTAFATRDIAATHDFYTKVMGFRLAKVVAAPTPPSPGATPGEGWARHVFYDCGNGEFIAFWDIHDPAITVPPSDLSKSIGLPSWVNHLAWSAPTEEAYQGHLQRWRESGITVAEVDHGFCKSIYTTDPNGIMVEFCMMLRELGAEDQAEAEALLVAELPELEGPPSVEIHLPLQAVPA